MPKYLLTGCQPEPLSGYLKALGVLRLVATQCDPQARGHWTKDGFVLSTAEDDLADFFLHRYRPTPIVSPWNGGSGFGPKDNKDGIDAIGASGDPRLVEYRAAVEAVKTVAPLAEKGDKAVYLQKLRTVLPDEALHWLDASAILTSEGIRFPILLGTGGNDGRLDFSNNFMQRLVDVLALVPSKKAARKGAPDRPSSWLSAALFGTGTDALVGAAIGQFDPAGNGGSNSSPGGKGASLVNPWDFVLMIEGSLVFAGSVVRRQSELKAAAGVPFTFHATAAGYGSATPENGRGEVWAPVWQRPARYRAVANLFAEGRIGWRGDRAVSALDAVRGVATLQADRRIDSFVRYSIVERFGLSNVAVCVGRLGMPSEVRKEVKLTDAFDGWLGRVRALGDGATPAGVRSALRQVELTTFALAQDEQDREAKLLDVLASVAALERACSRSREVRKKVAPAPRPSAKEWREQLVGLLANTPEAAAAWALASGRDRYRRETSRGWSLRSLLLPVRLVEGSRAREEWAEDTLVGGLELRPIAEVLAEAAMRRRWHGPVLTNDAGEGSGQRVSFELGCRCDAGNAVRLAGGRLDPERLGEYVRAFLTLNFDNDSGWVGSRPPDQPGPVVDSLTGAIFGCSVRLGVDMPNGEGLAQRRVPAGLPRALAAETCEALRLLERTIRTEGRVPHLASTLAGRGHWLASALLLNPDAAFAKSCAKASGYLSADLDLSSNEASTIESDNPHPSDPAATAAGR